MISLTCDYLLGFQTSRKINDSVLEKRWPRNDTNAKDDPYKTLALVYNREMDQLMVANLLNIEMKKKNILRLDDEKESKGLEITYPKDTTTDSDEDQENLSTPRSKMDKEEEKLTTPIEKNLLFIKKI